MTQPLHAQLRAARIRTGMTQIGAMKALGLTGIETVSRWERNETVPTGAHLRQLAVLYNCRFRWIEDGAVTTIQPKNYGG